MTTQLDYKRIEQWAQTKAAENKSDIHLSNAFLRIARFGFDLRNMKNEELKTRRTDEYIADIKDPDNQTPKSAIAYNMFFQEFGL